METRKVFITSINGRNEKINLEIVIDIPENIVYADIDYWAERKAVTVFYENYWTNTNSNKDVYEANTKAVTDALDMLDMEIRFDLLAKLKNECKKVMRNHFGYEVIDGTYFSRLSLSDMKRYLVNTGTLIEVYLMPKKRIKEVIK